MNSENNEIDLIELYRNIIIFLYNRRLTLIIFFFVGVILGLFYYYKNIDNYKTHFIAETSNVSKEVVYALAERIEFLFDTKEVEELNTILNIDKETLEKIKGFELDTTGNIFRIAVQSKSKESIDPFIEGLLSYFNNHSYILNSYNQQQEQLKKYIAQIDEELENINQFQQQMLREKNNGDIKIYQLAGSSNEKISLYKKKQDAELKLSQKEAICLINKSDNFIKKQTNLFLILGISVAVSQLLAYLFFFIIFSIKLIKTHH